MDALEGLRLRNIRTRSACDISGAGAEALVEPMTPAGRAFCHPLLNVHILVVCGLKTPCRLDVFKEGVCNTILKHKRFSSVVRENKRGELFWIRAEVNLDDHIIVPPLEEEQMNSPSFVEEYVAKLSQAPPLDRSRPLFEFHVLKAKLGDAVENVIFRVHHSLGDGISLMSLLLACTRRTDNPDLLPTIPRATPPLRTHNHNRGDKSASAAVVVERFTISVWRFLIMLWLTLVDVCMFIATVFWLNDSKTPIKGSPGVEKSARRFVHRTVSFEDVRFVKQATRGTVNDVMFGMLVMGLSSYLQHSSDKGHLRIRANALINTRRSPGLHELEDMLSGEPESQARWGNEMGNILIPIPLSDSENPLDHLRKAKEILDKKKLSLEAFFSYRSGALLMKLIGVEMPAKLTYRCCSQTTLSFSNVAGPLEEVQIFGHPITHILPTAVGQPQSLCIHVVSYMGKVSIIAVAAQDIIPDPEKLCDFMVNALEGMKQTIMLGAKFM